MSDETVNDRPEWDDETADALRGTYVLVGITTEDANGTLLAQVQLHGRVTDLAIERGVTIALEGVRAGETYVLPPDLRAWQPAPRGEYRLRSTGEVVVDPDYTASWTITKPPKT